MPVVQIEDGSCGEVVGITHGYCVYQLARTQSLAVAAWPELALANIRPAKSQLHSDVTEDDRRNSLARVLRELLALKQFGLSAKQEATLAELLAELCPTLK